MCGKETSGLTMAEPGLFRDKVFVLSPLPRTTQEALDLGRDLVHSIGARPLVLDAERHDRLVAVTSHLPYMLAVTLMRAAESFAQDDPLVWKLVASGFRDTSRLAGGDITMMRDIIATNRDQILRALRQAQDELAILARYLEEGDLNALEHALIAAHNRRLEVYR